MKTAADRSPYSVLDCAPTPSELLQRDLLRNKLGLVVRRFSEGAGKLQFLSRMFVPLHFQFVFQFIFRLRLQLSRLVYLFWLHSEGLLSF